MTLRPLAALLLAASLARAEEPAWRYVVPSPGGPHEHPPARVLPLGRQKPDDLKETARYRGKQQRYGQLVYGGPGSARVTVVLDEVAPGEADLYLDANRRRAIGPKDRVAGASGAWRVPLDAVVVEGGQTRRAGRTVFFRLGKATRTLSVATCGYVEGRVRLGEREVAARRADGDANGLLADPADRLWLDLDGDGRFDPLDEQFPSTPVLTFGPARFAVRSDSLGRALAFEKMEGAGTVRVAPASAALAARVEELEATLVGRDGSVFTLRGAGGAATLPAGDYRLNVVALTLKDAHGGQPWSFVFSDGGSDRPPRWHKVEHGGTLTLDPLGKLDFVVGLDGDATYRPGDDVSVQPRLFTEDGLLINTAYRGARQLSPLGGSSQAELFLGREGERGSATASSGFA